LEQLSLLLGTALVILETLSLLKVTVHPEKKPKAITLRFWCNVADLCSIGWKPFPLQPMHALLSVIGLPALGYPPPSADRGLQFNLSLWAALCEILSISHCQATAYYPDANGAIKRLYRRLKDMVCALAAAATWTKKIPWVLLSL
jgi:hypothetical protein